MDDDRRTVRSGYDAIGRRYLAEGGEDVSMLETNLNMFDDAGLRVTEHHLVEDPMAHGRHLFASVRKGGSSLGSPASSSEL